MWEGREGRRKAGPKAFNHSSKNRRLCCADVTDECFVSEEKKGMFKTLHNPELKAAL